MMTMKSRSLMLRSALAVALTVAMGGCSSLGGSGPATGKIVEAAEQQSYADSPIQIVELNAATLEGLSGHRKASSFAELFGESGISDSVIGKGDVLDIAIWEAPPAVLFGQASNNSGAKTAIDNAQRADIPQQRVGSDGSVTVPFVGKVAVEGRSPASIQREIVNRLRGKAHQPQVIVRLVDNQTRSVTILGEVASSQRMPLTARGERLLDAIASAGGARHSVVKSTVQLARGNTAAAMPLQSVIADPAQNVTLRPDDIISVQHKPFSFVALGAVNQNAEIPFEGSGLTLAEALGRVGGLNDNRADIRGVFLFRLEQPAALANGLPANTRTTQDGRVPVIYRLRMDDPASLFAMQDFAIEDSDVLYISTAPGADLQRFIATLSSTVFSVVAVGNALSDNQ